MRYANQSLLLLSRDLRREAGAVGDADVFVNPYGPSSKALCLRGIVSQKVAFQIYSSSKAFVDQHVHLLTGFKPLAFHHRF